MTDQPIDPRVRVMRAFGAMPYGAAANFHRPEPEDRRRPAWEALDFDMIADNLERLASVLAGVAKRDNEREAELTRYRRWVHDVEELAGAAAALAADPPEGPPDAASADEAGS